MAAKKFKNDPFALFSGLGDVDSSDLSSDDEEDPKEGKTEEKTKLSFITNSVAGSEDGALPSAKALFDKVQKPEFLDKKSKNDINWDRMTKQLVDPEKDDGLDRSNTNAMPPPTSYDIQTPAIPPAIGDPGEQGQKRPHDSNGEAREEKKPKT